MCGRDDLRVAGMPVDLRLPAPEGGEPRRLSGRIGGPMR
jgi:hypothetical protein